MELGLTQLGEQIASVLANYSPLTIGGGAVFVVAFLGWLISRWPDAEGIPV